MFDFSFGELAVIGTVALVVLGPERLPRVARTVGEWAGKAQRYVAQVKSDINREVELADLKKLQDEARNVARSIESTVQGNISSLQAGIDSTVKGLNTGFEDPASGDQLAADRLLVGRHRRRIRQSALRTPLQARPHDQRTQRRNCAAEAPAGDARTAPTRHKRSPRARVNKPRIRR